MVLQPHQCEMSLPAARSRGSARGPALPCILCRCKAQGYLERVRNSVASVWAGLHECADVEDASQEGDPGIVWGAVLSHLAHQQRRALLGNTQQCTTASNVL